MTATSDSPLAALAELSEKQATGELVCATNEAEVHVHLQHGRVAWATSTAGKFAFSNYILREAEIDAEAFRELLEECRRHRKPLGETLVAWGLATPEQIREALMKQIRESIGTLAGVSATFVFLPRQGYASYDAGLTFEYRDVAPQMARRARHASSQRFPAVVALPPSAELHSRLAALCSNGRDIRWIEHHAGEVTTFPTKRAARLDQRADAVFGAGAASMVVVRGPGENVLGLALENGAGQIWCGLDTDVLLGAMVILLRRELPTLGANFVAPTRSTGGEALISADRGISRATLSAAMERTPELLAIGMTNLEGDLSCLARRADFDPQLPGARVARADALLRSGPLGRTGREAPTDLRGSMLAVASADGWVYGAMLRDDTKRCLWLILQPDANQGLGWALLTALLRETNVTARELPRART